MYLLFSCRIRVTIITFLMLLMAHDGGAQDAPLLPRDETVSAIFAGKNDRVFIAFYSEQKQKLLAAGMHYDGQSFLQIYPNVDRVLYLRIEDGYVRTGFFGAAVGASILFGKVENGVESFLPSIDHERGVFEYDQSTGHFFAHVDVRKTFMTSLLSGETPIKNINVGMIRKEATPPGEDTETSHTEPDDEGQVSADKRISAIVSKANSMTVVAIFSPEERKVLAIGKRHEGRQFLEIYPDINHSVSVNSKDGYFLTDTLQMAIGTSIIISKTENGTTDFVPYSEFRQGIAESPLIDGDFLAHVYVSKPFVQGLLSGEIQLKDITIDMIRKEAEKAGRVTAIPIAEPTSIEDAQGPNGDRPSAERDAQSPDIDKEPAEADGE